MKPGIVCIDPADPAFESMLTHDRSNCIFTALNTLSAQAMINSWAAINTPVFIENSLYLPGQLPPAPFFPAFGSAPESVIPAFRYSVQFAQKEHIIAIFMLVYKPEDLLLGSELNSIVFFKRSFSMRSFLFSRSCCCIVNSSDIFCVSMATFS